MKPLLIIPVETKVRELEAKLLLGLIAVNKGLDVIVGGLTEIKYLVDVIDKGVYFDKSIAKTKHDWFQKCVAKGNKVVALDEEGLVYFDAETYRQLRIYPESMGFVDIFFAWGEDQKNVMGPALGSLLERIAITGNPRFDLLSPRFRPLYKDTVSSIRERFGKIILVNTSFSFGNSTNSIDGLRNTFAQYPIAKERPGFFEGWMDEQKNIMTSFVEVLPEIRERYPDHSIIIRPHPSENIEFWDDFCKRYSSMYAIREGGVVPWLLASDVLIHWNCTTAIEAFHLDVPAIAYRKNCSGKYAQPLPNAVSFHADDRIALFNKIDLALNDELKNNSQELMEKTATLGRYICPDDDTLAAEKIIDRILPLANSFERKRSIPEKGVQLSKKIWRGVLDNVIQDRKIRDEYSASKFPQTDVEEIQATLLKMKTCINSNTPLNARKIWTNCFYLNSGSSN